MSQAKRRVADAGVEQGGEVRTLDALLAPLSMAEFFADYWERRPVVRQPGRPERFRELLSVRDVEFLTASLGSLDAQWIRLVNNRESGPMREFQRPGGGLSMERVLEAYREGTTVVLNDLQRRWPAVRDLTRRLWRDFNDVAEVPMRAVGANAYLSPPNAQGLAVHFDSHCVLVLQLSGRKAWTLYRAREEMPSPDGQDRHAPSWYGPEVLEEPLHEVVLEAGDCVYIPRGLAHEARTAESHSLHLAVGLYPYTWGDALAHALRIVPECRRSLPAGSLSTLEPPPEVARALEEVVEALVERTTAAAALGPVRAELERLRERSEDRGFERHHAIKAIDGSSRVVRSGAARLGLRREGEKVLLELGWGSPLQAPAAAEPALRYILEHEAFTVASLPDALSERSKTVLVRRLLEEGVLELAAERGRPPASVDGGGGP